MKFIILERPKVSLRRESSENDTNVLLKCEVQFNCATRPTCPEALFDWSFNDRPVRSLTTRGTLNVGHGEAEVSPLSRTLPPPYPGLYKHADSSSVKMQQTSELEVSKAFAERNVGRFACNSIFGGATVEMESQALASMPTQLHVLSVSSNAVKLAWKHPGTVSERRRNAVSPLSLIR